MILEEGYAYETKEGCLVSLQKNSNNWFHFSDIISLLPRFNGPLDLLSLKNAVWDLNGHSNQSSKFDIISEHKWDTYYEKYLPYKMDLNALAFLGTTLKGKNAYFSEKDVLAYIRYIGIDNVRFYMEVPDPDGLYFIPFLGAFLHSGDKRKKAVCKIYINPENKELFDPLKEGDAYAAQHWYHPYKIQFTPTEFLGSIETMYFSDFVSGLERGDIEIWEGYEGEEILFPNS